MTMKGKTWERNWISSNSSKKNNVIRTNYIKVKLENPQWNSKCRLCGDRDKMINHIIGELVQKEYKTRHDWMRMVIHWELCKKMKFDHTTKWYMHKPESVLENEPHKILWNFEIQTHYLIPARRPDLVIIKKKGRTCCIVNFAIPADHRVKIKESIKRDKYLDHARELKKAVEYEWQWYQL